MNPCLARNPQHETACKTAQRLNSIAQKRALTFDMSGGPKGAKRPLERPLDGGVRCLRSACGKGDDMRRKEGSN